MTIEPWLQPPLDLQPEEEGVLAEDQKSLLEWLEEDYVLSRRVHGLADRWSRDYGPFWLPVIEWLEDTTTREVWVKSCTQIGKSTLGAGWIGYTVDVDPVPMGIVMPREGDATDRIETHIKPMFEENARLLRHCGGLAKNINIGKMTMFDNMALYLLYATSVASLANRTLCRAHLDEVGKYPVSVGDESDPISLVRDRLRTFRSRSKLFATSTPVLKGDQFDTEWSRGDCCQVWVPCVHCEFWQVPSFWNVVLDRDKDKAFLEPEQYRRGGHARYCCPQCGACWSETDRWEAVTNYRVVQGDNEILPNGKLGHPETFTDYHSIQLPALLVHPAITTVGDLAAEWADQTRAWRLGRKKKRQHFWNSQLAQDWVEQEKEPQEEKLRAHADIARQGVVPVGVQVITAFADIQVDHAWLMVVGWGYQFEGWIIHADRIDTGDTEKLENYKLIHDFFAKLWPVAEPEGKFLRATIEGIDMGYQSETVRTACRRWADLNAVPVKGFGSQDPYISAKLYRPVKITDYETRYDVNVDLYKDAIHRQLFVAEVPGPAYIHLPKDLPDDHLRQFLAEHSVRKQAGRTKREVVTWEKIRSNLDNHLWDCLVGNRFLADLIGVAALGPAQPIVPRAARPVVHEKPIRTKY